MASTFAVWLRVTPPPVTIAESRAVLKHLTQQGRVTTFIKRPAGVHDAGGASYLAVFSHEPPSLPTTFEVPVHHNVPNPRDEDPFNLRGLQHRKPHPHPTTFSCQLSSARPGDEQAWIQKQGPYHGRFAVDKAGIPSGLMDVYRETGASAGIARALASFGPVGPAGPAGPDGQGPLNAGKHAQVGKQKKLKMHSLMETWSDAVEAGRSSPSHKHATQSSISQTEQSEALDPRAD